MVARNLALISISKVAVFIWAHTSNVTFAVKQSTGTTYDGYLVYPQNSNIKMSKLVGRAGSVYKNGRPVIAKKLLLGRRLFSQRPNGSQRFGCLRHEYARRTQRSRQIP